MIVQVIGCAFAYPTEQTDAQKSNPLLLVKLKLSCINLVLKRLTGTEGITPASYSAESSFCRQKTKLQSLLESGRQSFWGITSSFKLQPRISVHTMQKKKSQVVIVSIEVNTRVHVVPTAGLKSQIQPVLSKQFDYIQVRFEVAKLFY